MSEQQANKTPLSDLRKDALEHYEEMANEFHYWNSFIPKAIKNYDPQATQVKLTLTEKHILESLLENYSKDIVTSAVTGGYVSKVGHEVALKSLKEKIANITPTHSKV